MKQKQVFIIIFIALTLMLMLMPLTLSINDAMTQGVANLGWYVWIEKNIIPIEIQLVGVIVTSLGIKFAAFQNEFYVNGNLLRMDWNCLGWQSLILFLISTIFGLMAGKYTLLSKLEAFAIGLLGTFLINLIRIVLIVVILVISKPLYAFIFHDYLAAITTIIWLFVFWWFSYKFVLQEK
jgi:exosortase/archaeosortase family protein